MAEQPSQTIREDVREHYAEIARSQPAGECCASDCCEALYPAAQTAELPASVTDISLGCGDPVSLADIRPGDTVLDLGSGGGIDCFLAARRVGPAGRVIGVDMTPEMLERARSNALKVEATNVEFRAGYLENLPVEDGSVDVVISNCVINLSPDKPQVFREMFRVLRPDGRVAVSDMVTDGPMSLELDRGTEAWCECLAGALEVRDYQRGLEAAGFVEVTIRPKDGAGLASAVPKGRPFSALITARKPSARGGAPPRLVGPGQVTFAPLWG